MAQKVTFKTVYKTLWNYFVLIFPIFCAVTAVQHSWTVYMSVWWYIKSAHPIILSVILYSMMKIDPQVWKLPACYPIIGPKTWVHFFVFCHLAIVGRIAFVLT